MKQIYFDNAASSHPKPENVYRRTFQYVRQNGANSGRSSHDLAMQAAQTVYTARSELCRFFDAGQPENIVFTGNASYALNTVIKGLLKSGDHVITTDLEHNSVLRPLYDRQNHGIELDIVETDLYDDAVTVRRIKDKIKPNTRAIIVTQCSNVCGKILPIGKLSELRSNRIRLVVDGSQGAGSVPTSFENSGIDYYCAPSHKGLLGIQGGGILICRHNELEPLIFGGTGGESTLHMQPEFLPDRLEAGTLPIPAICSMTEGIRFIQKVGIHKIFEHKKALVKYLYHGLLKIQSAKVCADYDKFESPGVLSFNFNGVSSEELGEYLAQRGVAVRSGLHCAPLFHQKMGSLTQGMVRVSFGFSNSFRQIDSFLYILKEF